ncbi:TPA: restriction endonuclease subunit S [Yersinia enterocolitica]|nr:restriction endonuclease subunit S [Yersinia enterocolitica]HDL7430535.1 restriction endonuclease subunit S [Yersinia enterocolitica]HDL7472981.1 restriction endonuclease subunit S [Yersinia enterocolitica]
MSMDKKVPEIRFKGFGGAWYEVALSSVIDIRSGKDYKHLGKGNIPVYGTGGYMLSVDSALSNDDDAIGIGRKGTIDKPCILRAPFWTVDTLFYAVPFPGFNLDFLFCLFQKIEWKKHDESTGVPSLSKIAINNVSVYATNELEQTAIGNYFQKLDSLINQHQQKHDKLSNIKKAILEKMFPKQGETIPEIRFKGFSGGWEEKVLGDEMTVTSVKRILQSDWTVSGVRFLRARDIVSAYKNEEPADYLYIAREKYNEYSQLSGKVEVGDLLVTGVGTIGVPMLITNGEPVYFKDGNIIWFKNENKIDGMFLFYSFVGDLIQTYIKHSAGTGTVGTYTINSGKNTPIKLPTREEQTAIGNYFQKLDALINQHQQQITKLNNIKQACLSKMFV